MGKQESTGMDLEKIRAESKDVNLAEAAAEILVWLRDNVDKFVDNERTDYNVVFNTISVAGTSPFVELRKLEKLFSRVFAITGPTALSENSPNPAEATAADVFKRLMAGESISEEEHEALQEAWGTATANLSLLEEGHAVGMESDGLEILYPVLDAVLEELQKSTPLLIDAADKLAYFYELRGWKEGQAIEQKFDATLDFNHLEYSPDPVIMAKRRYEDRPQPDGTIEHVLIETKYRLGCAGGFMVSFILRTKPKEVPASLF